MIKLIWTYDGKMSKGDDTSKNRIILINYYIHSIVTAKKFGYETIIYCDSNSKKYFEDIVDEIVIVESYEDSIVWDYMKVKVMEDRNDEFYLIDGDIILHDKLPEPDSDIVFDTYETANWVEEYSYTTKQLEDLGVNSTIPYWESNRKPVISTGIFYLKPEFREDYVSEFKKCNKFINDTKDDNVFDKDYISLVGGQYLLTLFVNQNNLSKTNINSNMGEMGKYYKHYFGKMKFQNPIVSSERIMKNEKTGLI
jgi:hypothetical protein